MRGRSPWLLLALLLLGAWLRSRDHREYLERDPAALIPYGDSVVYLEEARRQFGEDGDRDTAFYKHPLYAFLLYALEADTEAGKRRVLDLQWLLGLVSLGCAFWLARSRGGDLAGAVAFVLLLFYGPLAFHETKLLDTTLGVATLALGSVALDSWLRSSRRPLPAFLAGVLLGVAALARSPALLVAALGVLAAWRASRRSALCLAAGAILPVAPVTLHNVLAEGDLVLIATGDAFTFLAGNNPNSTGVYAPPPGYEEGVRNEREIEWRRARAALGREPTLAEVRAFTISEATRYLSHHPGRIVELLLLKARFALSSHEIDDNYSLARERERFGLLGAARVPFAVLLALGILGLFLCAPPRTGFTAPLLVTAAVLLVFYVTSRFRLPAAPFLAALSGIGTVRLFARTADVPMRRRVFAAAIALVAFAVSWWAPLPVPRERLVAAERMLAAAIDDHAADVLLAARDKERAVRVLAMAADAYPEVPAFRETLYRTLRWCTTRERDRLFEIAQEAARGELARAAIDRALAEE